MTTTKSLQPADTQFAETLPLIMSPSVIVASADDDEAAALETADPVGVDPVLADSQEE